MKRAAQAFSQGERAWLIAGMTFREAVRQKLIAGFLLAALGMVGGMQAMRTLNFGTSELRFVLDLGFGVIGLPGAVLAIAVTTVLVFNELERRTVLTVLARPITRGTFIVGKWLGVSALLGLYVLILTLALVGLLVWRGDPNVRLGDVMLAGALQAVKLGVLAAATLMLGTLFRTALLTAVLAVFVLVICQLQPVLAELAARVEGTGGRALAAAVAAGVPNFQAFDLTALLASGEPVGLGRIVGLVLYGAGYSVVACVAATVIFRYREL